jgi:hypothetical protein
VSAHQSADNIAYNPALVETIIAANFAAIGATDQSAYRCAVDAANRATDSSTYNPTI